MRRFATIALSALLLIGGSALTAPAADAATVHPDGLSCPSNDFCLYQYTNYGGDQFIITVRGFVCDFTNYNWNNKASSMINNTGTYVTLYQYVGCNPNGGQTYVAKPHSSDSSFANNNFDNKASGADLP